MDLTVLNYTFDNRYYFKTPELADEGCSGYDLYASFLDNEQKFFNLLPGQRTLVHTNLFMSIPKGYEGQVRSKSGLALKSGIMVLNSPGTVDCVPTGTLIKSKEGDIEVSKLKEMFDNGVGVDVISYKIDDKSLTDDILDDIWLVENVELIEFEFENGSVIKIPPSKLLYTKDEGWKFASELTGEEEILSFE